MSIPTQSLPWPRFEEDVVDAVEICEVRVDLNDPIGLSENDGADKDQANWARKERLEFHPRDDVVQ